MRHFVIEIGDALLYFIISFLQSFILLVQEKERLQLRISAPAQSLTQASATAPSKSLESLLETDSDAKAQAQRLTDSSVTASQVKHKQRCPFVLFR